MEKLLIIGGVAGGATAAAKARRLSQDIEITMLEAGPDVSFANCGLPYYIGGDIKSRSKLILESPETFKDQYNVTVKTMTEAIKIDTKNKVVTALDKNIGENVDYSYDKLIMAQGGKPIVPPLPGVNQKHVFSLWTLDDMDAIHNYIENDEPKSAVVIGGGFIGLEMVEALVKRGLDVHVIEMQPHVMPLMESEIAGFIQEEMEAFGVGIHTNRAVTSIATNTVELDNGETIPADMVLMSVGVRPTLQLAIDTGLEIGEAGGLSVDETLKTSDENIYGAGDMVEITHKVGGKKVRIPLAGPANRQGRVAASNALGHKMVYRGSQGTSVVRIFEAVAGSTGLNQKQAMDAGFDAQSIVVHKEHHTSYFPGSSPVTVLLTYDAKTGVILGGQTAGYQSADKRLDVIATATACKMTIDELSDLDLSYSPPIGTANDAVNMAAFVAQNRASGYSPSITVSELDEFVGKNRPAFIDVRDYFSFEKSHITGADLIAHTQISEKLAEIPTDRPILIYSEKGKKGHQVVRELMLKGFKDVYNIAGGFPSIERYARAIGFEHLHLNLLPIEKKSLHELEDTIIETEEVVEEIIDTSSPIVIDVRSPEEFMYGAYPGAINLSLDELESKANELGDKDRDITLYCASGARSAYGVRILQSIGFTNAKNGGGLMSMMSGLN